MSCYIPVVDKKNLFMPYLFNSATITARNSNHICNIHLLQPRMITTIRPYLTRHRDIPTTPAPSSDTKYRQSITISLSLWLYLHPPPPKFALNDTITTPHDRNHSSTWHSPHPSHPSTNTHLIQSWQGLSWPIPPQYARIQENNDTSIYAPCNTVSDTRRHHSPARTRLPRESTRPILEWQYHQPNTADPTSPLTLHWHTIFPLPQLIQSRKKTE